MYAFEGDLDEEVTHFRGPPYAHPLMNFVWLLLVAIEHRESIAVFSLLVDKYRASLQRDPSYLGYLDR